MLVGFILLWIGFNRQYGYYSAFPIIGLILLGAGYLIYKQSSHALVITLSGVSKEYSFVMNVSKGEVQTLLAKIAEMRRNIVTPLSTYSSKVPRTNEHEPARSPEKDTWSSKLYYNKGLQEARARSEEPESVIKELLAKIQMSDPSLLETLSEEFHNNESYRKGYTDGLTELMKNRPKINYNRGFGDSEIYDEKSLNELVELLKKIENHDPSLLEIFPEEFHTNENYRNGMRDGIRTIVRKKRGDKYSTL
jgi:hypothetical protein